MKHNCCNVQSRSRKAALILKEDCSQTTFSCPAKYGEHLDLQRPLMISSKIPSGSPQILLCSATYLVCCSVTTSIESLSRGNESQVHLTPIVISVTTNIKPPGEKGESFTEEVQKSSSSSEELKWIHVAYCWSINVNKTCLFGMLSSKRALLIHIITFCII